MGGHQISKGGQAAAAVHKLVDDARRIEHLHADLFTQGTKRARDNGGSYEYCVSTGAAESQSAEQKLARQEQNRSKKRKTAGGLDSLFGVSSKVYPPQEAWAAMSTKEDLKRCFQEYRQRL